MPEQDTFNDEILILDESGEFKLVSDSQSAKITPAAAAGGKSASVKPTTSIIDTGMEEPMLQPPPPVVRSANASFYFHPSDEEEVAKIKTPVLPQKKYSLDKIIAKLTADFKLNFSAELASRFRALSFNYLRDRKTLVETADALKRQSSQGGLEITPEIAEHLMAFLTEVKTRVTKEQGLIVDETLRQAQGEQALGSEPVVQKSGSPVKPPEPAVVKAVPVMESIPVSKPAAAPTPKEVFLPPKRLVKPLIPGKVPMGDVHKDYKLVGPLEELNSLSLLTFRRLGASTVERTAKIFSKIDYLGKESLVKKAGGVKAWRQSPLYKMYLAIGQASLEHSLAISEIIKQYQAQGEEIMTLEEFEAIGDLNRRLRF